MPTLLNTFASNGDPAPRSGEFSGDPAFVRAFGDALFGSIHPDDRERIKAARSRSTEAGAAYVVEYRLSRESGGWGWVQEAAAPIGGGGAGQFSRWIAVISDIDKRMAAEQALRASEERLRLCVRAIGVGIWEIDLLGGAWRWSPEMKEIFGLRAGATPSEQIFWDCIHPEDRGVVAQLRSEAPDEGIGLPSAAYRILRQDNSEQRWVISNRIAVLDDEGRPARLIGTVQDVTDRKRAELEREASELRLNAALEVGRMVVWDLHVPTGIVTRSANAQELFGSRKEHISQFVARVLPEDRAKVTWESSSAPTPPSGDVQFRYQRPDGAQLWLQTSAIKIATEDASSHIVGLTMDITEEKEAEAELIRIATHDTMTRLLNRKAWTKRLWEAVSTAAAKGDKLYLLILDLDFFKSINDGFGHDAGDRVLRSVGERLEAMSPHLMFAARLGGDEFAALLRIAGAAEDPKTISDLLIRKICEPIRFEDRSIVVGASVGVACFPDDARTSGDLMKNADLALYAAKQAGRRQTCLFRAEMRAAIDARISLESAFKRALAAGRIIPFYQPKLDLATGALVGFEALARWNHPERGLLTPAFFGAVFDDGQIAVEIGAVMRRAVLQDLKSWLAQGLAVGGIAVNCAAHEFRGGDLADTILGELREAGVPPSRFEVEVTEGVMVGRDAENVAKVLTKLHDAGVKISLDDFGTGYASLIHLKQFPVDEIKLDRSFVAEMDRDPNPAIIRAILAMGQSLGLATVAEGVETMAQADALSQLGCKQAQGYFFSRPLSAERTPWFAREGVKRFEIKPQPKRAAF